jgi:hypothetical protein
MSDAREFQPFPDPDAGGDTPLVQSAGFAYRCSGCGGEVGDGMHLHTRVRDGMVVGVAARRGTDGPVEHECGEPPTLT